MKRLMFITMTLAGVLLAGCLTDRDSLAGIEGTGSPATVSGSVTAYGSIYVNGIHIDIDTADVEIDGNPADIDDIELGMVVDVDTDTIQNGESVANEVRYARSLRGPISERVAVSDVRTEVRILGQTVLIYSDAQFADVEYESLSEGQWLDISGYADAEGRWTASRVAAAEPSELDARGAMVAWGAENQRFRLGAQRVDASEAEVIGRLEEGQNIRVRGGEQRDELWFPARIEVLDRPVERNGAQWFKEGVIERFLSREEFDLGGVTVNAGEADWIGADDNLEVGDRVTVGGELRDGVVMADRVQVLRLGVNRIRARIDTVDATNGELTLLGNTYHTTALTAFENPAGRGNPQGRVNLNSLRSGDWVDVFAYYREETQIITRIKRQPGNIDSVILAGPVTEIDQGNRLMTVLGVTVSIADEPGFALFDQLEPGDFVSVVGVDTGSQSLEAISLSDREVPPDVQACPPPVANGCGPLAGLSVYPANAEGLRFSF